MWLLTNCQDVVWCRSQYYFCFIQADRTRVYPSFPGGLFTVPSTVLSKPRAAFPHNIVNFIDSGQREMNPVAWISILWKTIGWARDRTSDLLSPVHYRQLKLIGSKYMDRNASTNKTAIPFPGIISRLSWLSLSQWGFPFHVARLKIFEVILWFETQFTLCCYSHIRSVEKPGLAQVAPASIRGLRTLPGLLYNHNRWLYEFNKILIHGSKYWTTDRWGKVIIKQEVCLFWIGHQRRRWSCNKGSNSRLHEEITILSFLP